MPIRISFFLIALAAMAACDPTEPTLPTDPLDHVATGESPHASIVEADRAAMDRLARRLARSMADPGFRAYVRTELDRSPIVEHKLHLQRFLSRSNGHVSKLVAKLAGDSESSIAADARTAGPLEIYFPVPEHRAKWAGGSDVLVASAREDHDAPVAYDTRGRRQVLSSKAPPPTPVLAIGPVETDFGTDGAVAFAVTQPEPPPPTPQPAPTPPTGMYMTYARFVQDFEGWLKGSPEYELHILGQSGTSDSLTDYQCAGASASGYYRFDQNELSWSGKVLLFTQAQLNNYRIAHPNQNFRIIALEDDDGACQIKFDGSRFKALQSTLQSAYPDLTGSKDTSTSIGRIIKRANALQKILRAAYSFITTQDDLIGNAIEDVVVNQFIPGANWIVRGDGNVTNGWIKVEMR
jgi:hypothetical protein